MARRRREVDALVLHGARRRKRIERRRRRKRAGLIVVLALITLAVLVAAAGFGAGAAISASCSLSSLKPVDIGANTFVYAADGSLLGSIPAERNREPVPLKRMSSWLPQATVAVEDKRFYQHGGIDYVGIIRALWADVSAGKVVEGGSTITQQLVRNMYTGREKTFDRKVKEACLAIKLADRWSKPKILADLPEHRLLREPRLRRRGRVRDVLLAAGEEPQPRAGGADRRAAPGALDLRPAAQPEGGARPPHRGAEGDARGGGRSRGRSTAGRCGSRSSSKPGRLYTRIKQPYFFSYVIDQLEQVYGANVVREGGLRVYTTIEPRLQYDANVAIRETLNEPNDPAAAIVSVEPGTGAIRAMTAVIPGNKHNQFNLAAQSARQAGSTFKTFVLAAAIEKGIDPDTTYYTSAPFTCTTGPWCEDDYKAGQAVDGEHLRPHLRRDDLGHERDAPLGQHGLRAADARRRPGQGLAAGEEPRRQPDPEAGRLDRSRRAVGLAARHGRGLRHLRGRRHLRQADGDSQGDPSERQGRQDRRLGKAADEARRSRRAWPGRSTRCSRRTRSTAPAQARATGRIRTRARRARRPTTPTPGSTATRATSRRSSGWATRAARSRCSTSTARRSPARRSRCRCGTST